MKLSLGIFGLGLFAVVLAADSCPVIIEGGNVALGVNCLGHLIAPLLPRTGLRLRVSNSTQYESLALGTYEGEAWGASATDLLSGKTFAGYANLDWSGSEFLSGVSFFANQSDAVSVVNLTSGTLQVTHHYRPSPFTPSLYECTVTFKNIGQSVLTDLRYRRAMDWDNEPNWPEQCIDFVTGTSNDIEYTTSSPATKADPRNPNAGSVFGPSLFQCRKGGAPCPLLSYGPRDMGADFIFYLHEIDRLTPRTLLPGEASSFKVYYGGAENKTNVARALESLPASEVAEVSCLIGCIL
jgi:hypothetical protein